MFHDNDLQRAVLAELSWEPSVTAAHIGVTAHEGVITLTGHVQSFAEKHAAEQAALRVRGVTAVAEEILVRLPDDARRTDTEIAAAAIDRLAWDVTIPRDSVVVTVEGGWVTLSGEVDWHYQKLAAEQDVRPLFGVVGVSNQTAIKPRVNTVAISDDIMHALHRSWLIDLKAVTVTTDGGAVRLGGTVRSGHDRQVAAATAWAAPGTTAVVNDLTISHDRPVLSGRP